MKTYLPKDHLNDRKWHVIDADGQVTSVTDARSILEAWRGLCAAAGVDGSKTIVVGEPD